MKLASIKSGRDGQLVVVSDDLAWYAEAGHIAVTLQDALDDWGNLAPRLENLATDLAHDVIPKFRFHEREAASPLPRAFGWAGGPAPFQAPRDAITLGDTAWVYAADAAVIVVTGDVPAGVAPADARDHIVLVGLCHTLVVQAAGFDRSQSNPVNSFSPVFVTPDTLGDHWDGARLNGVLFVDVNGAPLSRNDAGATMAADFGALIAHAAKTGPLGAGTIISPGMGGDKAAPATSGLAVGDTIRIWMEDGRHHPIFGVIEHIAR